MNVTLNNVRGQVALYYKIFQVNLWASSAFTAIFRRSGIRAKKLPKAFWKVRSFTIVTCGSFLPLIFNIPLKLRNIGYLLREMHLNGKKYLEF